MSVAAPARRLASARSAGAAPARHTGPAHLIPAAVGRTASTVRHLPDSGLVTGISRRRAWIMVLGVMLAGIVAINVVSLSLSSSASKLEQRAATLEQKNSALEASLAQTLSTDRVEAAAIDLGMVRPGTDEYAYRSGAGADVSRAADRIAAVE